MKPSLILAALAAHVSRPCSRHGSDLDLLLPALLTGAITTHAAAPALGVTVRTVQRHLEAAGGGRPSSARAPAKITRTTLRNCPRCSWRRLRREPWNMASALSVLFTGGEAVPVVDCRLAAMSPCSSGSKKTDDYLLRTHPHRKSTSLGKEPYLFLPDPLPPGTTRRRSMS